MERLTKVLGAAVVAVLCSTSLVLSDDHVTLKVSCSIPAVPGLNAPLVEEAKPVKQADEKQQTVRNEQKQQEETVVEEKDGDRAIVKTFYAR